jgi:hypothetical protein
LAVSKRRTSLPGRSKKYTARTDTMRWRKQNRQRSLAIFSRRAQVLSWSPQLLRLLVEEMWADEELSTLIGSYRRIRVSQYPHALAVVLAIRHSWRQDDLRRIARMLRITTRGL